MNSPGTRTVDPAATVASPELPDELTVAAARDWLQAFDDSLNRAFDSARPIEELVHSRAAGVDRMVIRAWQAFGPDVEVALVAVGGYGRGELHPYSDIDLMILTREPLEERHHEAVSSFLTFLWDLRLDIGHSVRSLDDCEREARADVTVTTNLMEARLIWGQQQYFEEMAERLKPPKVWPGPAYFKAKLEEQIQRHHRYHDTVYNLEPSIKGGLGGLRDIQMVGWVAKRHYGVESLAGLVDVDFLEPEEYQALMGGQRYLWRVRWALHRLAGRREDRLLFDHQRDLAQLFGYRDETDNLGVEQFMQVYFRTVMQIERLNERLLQAFREDILGAGGEERVEPVNERFQIRNGYLEICDEFVFDREPSAMLELFLVLQQRPDIQGVRASTVRTLRRHLDLIDDEFRGNPEHRRMFMALLRNDGELPELLGRMHRYGVLGRYLLPFGQIIGRMQYDLFHVYTVDQHTLFVLRNMHGFFHQPDTKRFPMVDELARRLPKRELLYLAGLFHDIAKGRGGDHSELGEMDAEQFCREHEIPEAETRLVKWLVRQHLLMSVTAQRQDISDPEVVNRFARQVGKLVYLDYLYLLTLADISATSPKLWNSWKASLLSDLYLQARDAIQRGLENPVRRSEWIGETRGEARELLRSKNYDDELIDLAWSNLPDEYFLRHEPEQIAWQTPEMLDALDREGPHVAVRRKSRRGTTEVLVAAENRDGSFATIVATLGQMDLNIVDARVVNTQDGRIVDTFQLFDRRDRAVDSEHRVERIRDTLRENLSRDPLEPPEVDRPLTGRLRHFVRAPEITFSHSRDDPRTTMELICSDRPALLALVARCLLRNGVRVHGARIATFGERVEDYFQLSDMNDRPLGREAEEQLREDLERELSSGMPEPFDAEGMQENPP